MASKKKTTAATASSSQKTQYTSRTEIDDDGRKEIYIYLYSGDELKVKDEAGKQFLTCKVAELSSRSASSRPDGPRKWEVTLVPGDELETGRPDLPDPPTQGGGG